MRFYDLKAKLAEITGQTIFDGRDCVEIVITGDHPELIPIVRGKLEAAGIEFTQSRHRKFKGCTFAVPIHNIGTAFAANWVFGKKAPDGDAHQLRE